MRLTVTRSIDDLEFLNDVTEALAKETELQRILDMAMTKAMEFTGFNRASVFLASRLDPGFLEMVAWKNIPVDFIIKYKRKRIEDTMTGSTFQKGSVRIMLTKDSPFSTKDDLLRAGINTAISISLTSCGGMIGVLNIGSEREVSEIHVSRDALASMGMIIGLAVERAQYNSAVQEVEETYKNLFVNAVHGLYRSAPDGRVIMVNPTLVKMLGYEREEELMQLNAERDIFVNPEDRKRFVDEMLSKGRVQHFETLNRRKDGSVIAVSDSAIAVRDKKNNLLYFQGIIEDISEKKALETKLRESEGLYRGLVEHSLVAVFLVQDERFRYVNQQMCQIFGYAQEELLIAEDPLSLVYPPDRDVVAGYFARVRKGEIDSFRHKFNAVRKDGKVIVVEILGARTEYQGMPAVIATGIDKTEEIRLQEQLLHSQKMESIGTLAGGLAHDFNNILGGIIGFSSFIKTIIKPDDRIYSYIEIIEESAKRGADLTAQILGFARGGKYKVNDFNINNSIRRVVQIAERSANKLIRIDLNLDHHLPEISGDEGQIEQCIMNLCLNAFDAMPEGGELSIATSMLPADAVARLYLDKSKKYLSLKVRDTGAGMTDEQISRCFEPFFSTKHEMGRTGLGLSMVYGIISNHEGRISVRSEINKGSEFEIILPVTRTGVNGTREAIVSDLSELAGKGKILVVDDEKNLRILLRDLLSKYGYDCIEAENGLEAVRAVKREETDLVILDLIMPVCDGIEAFSRIRELSPEKRILICSGFNKDKEIRNMLAQGGVDFIQKPFTERAILTKIKTLLK